MQLTEVSVLGLRTSVTVFRNRSTALRFVLIPTIHMGRPDYYRRIAERLGRCHLIVAEMIDGPSSTGLAYVTALRLTGRHRGGTLVHQDIDYEALGVPTLWPGGRLLPGRRRRMPLSGWLDLILLVPTLTVGMAVGGRDWLLRRGYEISDDSDPRMRAAIMQRLLLDNRDADLVTMLAQIHEDRQGEPVEVGVVYGAAHMPAVVHAMSRLGYRPERGGEWLLAIDL